MTVPYLCRSLTGMLVHKCILLVGSDGVGRLQCGPLAGHLGSHSRAKYRPFPDTTAIQLLLRCDLRSFGQPRLDVTCG